LPTEYDEYLQDPTGYLLHKFMPRTATAFEPLAKLPDFPAVNYLTMLNGLDAFADPDVRKGLQSLMDAGEEIQILKAELMRFVGSMAELGYPLLAGTATFTPFDVLTDFMRGAKGGMLDMYRNKEKLLRAMDMLFDFLIREVIRTAKMTPSKVVFIPLHWGLDGFMSPKQFEEFYWPGCQRLFLALIDAGLTPCPLWEGDCTTRLDIIKDVPPGKCIYFFERTDLFKAKEILGDTVCIRGGMPVSTLIQGSVEDVKDQCKRMIDVVGDGGGFIMDSGVGLPDEAKPENVRAMFEVTREYGTYR
jgi:uroporphyrinogen-III decarboxylase